MKVAAIVVTYNRVELLAQTLEGLEAQERKVDHIIIIDNASTDTTGEYLQSREFAVPHTVETLDTNTGGAGGFAAGVDLAYQMGFDAFWVMDDDTVPRPTALGPLIRDLDDAKERLGYLPSFACSLVLFHEDGQLCEMNVPVTRWDWPRPLALGAEYLLVEQASFVSCLITREAVYAKGLPAANFFIWYDDAEYTRRLSKHAPGIFVKVSIADHLIPQNRGVNWGDVNASNIWKFRYGARNQMASAVAFRSPTIAAGLVETMIKQFHGSKVPWKLRLELVGCAIKGLAFKPDRRPARTVE